MYVNVQVLYTHTLRYAYTNVECNHILMCVYIELRSVNVCGSWCVYFLKYVYVYTRVLFLYWCLCISVYAYVCMLEKYNKHVKMCHNVYVII